MPPERALHLAYTLPYPARSGYDHRVGQICRHLSRSMEITLLSRSMQPNGHVASDLPEDRAIQFQTLYLPRPRLTQKLSKGLRFLFSSYPVAAGGWYFPEMARAIENELSRVSYSRVVLEGIWLSVYWPILERWPVLKVVNHFDLEVESLQRQARILPAGVPKWLYQNAARRMKKLESHIVRRADMNWVTSRREQEILSAQNPGARVKVAPNGVDTTRLQPLPREDSREILFVGALSYLPNQDGVSFFIREILPLIRRNRPDVVFRVIGKAPDSSLQALHAPPHVEITGEVEELESWYRRAALCVVPLRAGGGTRLKMLEAMAYGRPVVSTALGAEGIDAESGRHLLIADSPEEFAHAVLRLLQQPEQAQSLIKNARRLVEEKYAWKSIADYMATEYAKLAGNQKQPDEM
jgi:glycosyltransferase involved in cell wall biosynthesis